MSTELKAKGPLLLTRFWGGQDRGTCLQLTKNGPPRDYGEAYVQVRYEDLPALIADLQAAHDGSIGTEHDDE